MPLSEEELRLLEQMERALVEEDPKFASTLRGTSLRRSARRRAIAAGAVFVIGVVLLMVGVTTAPVIGVAGFVVMLGSATVALTSLRGQQHAASSEQGTSTHQASGFTVIEGGRKSASGRFRRSRRSSSSSSSFMERMEERWRRRRESGGF